MEIPAVLPSCVAVFLTAALCAPVAATGTGASHERQDWQVQAAPAGSAARQDLTNTMERAARGRHTAAIFTGTSLALAVYGKSRWWQDGFRGRFTQLNEGWFGNGMPCQ